MLTFSGSPTSVLGHDQVNFRYWDSQDTLMAAAAVTTPLLECLRGGWIVGVGPANAA